MAVKVLIKRKVKAGKLNDAAKLITGARYNAQTRWPADFSPDAAGCILIEGMPF